MVGGTSSGNSESQTSVAPCTSPTIPADSGGTGGGQFVSGDVTLAVFGTIPLASMAVSGNGLTASVTMLRVATAPVARAPTSHVTNSAASAVQPSGDDTNVKPTGN